MISPEHDLRLSDLLSTINMVQQFLEQHKEFDRAVSIHFEIHPHCLRLFVTISDDFQQYLSYDQKSYQSLQHFESENFSMEEIWKQLRRIPSRRLRELEVLARQAGNAVEMGEKLRTEQARAFAEEIASLRNALANLLRDERNLAEDEEFLQRPDGEIPF